jgi:aryl-alcohol dehydrogenase-like predicted oxidoreductase
VSELPLRRLGPSDLHVSVVGLGCNNFGGRIGLDETAAVLDAALDSGINFLDTADTYGNQGGSEELLGELLQGRRDQVVLATKFGMDMKGANGEPAGPRGSRPYIRQACEASLRRLRVETIDLYQYHEPDWDTPIEETLGALDELRREGKIRWPGCSNFSAGQLLEAERAARDGGFTPFVAVQNEYSLLKRSIERDVLPLAERMGVGVLPYFPLASGLLTGKYRRGEEAPAGTRLAGRSSLGSDADLTAVEALARFAESRGVEPIDVAIGWLAAQPCVASVIAGATKPEQARRNAQAGLWQPTAADLAEIDAIVPPQHPFRRVAATA